MSQQCAPIGSDVCSDCGKGVALLCGFARLLPKWLSARRTTHGQIVEFAGLRIGKVLMADKSQKMLARTPRGFADRTPDDIRAVEKMMGKIREVYELYGFEPADQPLIEYTDALGKFLPDQDRPNEGVFSFQDDDEQWLSLRYDLTAPMARYVAENFEKLPKPFRSYRSGWVFRNEKPGPGRFRQFMQFDADTVGTPGVAADAEMAMMMADVMEALGIARGDYVIRVNNRKVLDGVLEAIGLGGDENAGRQADRSARHRQAGQVWP
jgi:histidyl-tRNA synthetase